MVKRKRLSAREEVVRKDLLSRGLSAKESRILSPRFAKGFKSDVDTFFRKTKRKKGGKK